MCVCVFAISDVSGGPSERFFGGVQHVLLVEGRSRVRRWAELGGSVGGPVLVLSIAMSFVKSAHSFSFRCQYFA